MAAPEIPCEIRDRTRAIALPRHSDSSALAEHPSGDAGGIGMRHMSVPVESAPADYTPPSGGLQIRQAMFGQAFEDVRRAITLVVARELTNRSAPTEDAPALQYSLTEPVLARRSTSYVEKTSTKPPLLHETSTLDRRSPKGAEETRCTSSGGGLTTRSIQAWGAPAPKPRTTTITSGGRSTSYVGTLTARPQLRTGAPASGDQLLTPVG